jgi:hypothetical protein
LNLTHSYVLFRFSYRFGLFEVRSIQLRTVRSINSAQVSINCVRCFRMSSCSVHCLFDCYVHCLFDCSISLIHTFCFGSRTDFPTSNYDSSNFVTTILPTVCVKSNRSLLFRLIVNCSLTQCDLWSIGILAMLDDECRLPKGSDRNFAKRMYEQYLPEKNMTVSENTRFHASTIQKSKTVFCIRHFAGLVAYSAASWKRTKTKYH